MAEEKYYGNFYRYKISVTFHIKNKAGEIKAEFKPQLYNYLAIKKDYFDAFVPEMKLNCKLGMRELNWLVNYERYVTCSLTLYQQNSADESFSSITTTKVIEDIFLVYFDKNSVPRYFETSMFKKDPNNPEEELDDLQFTEENMAGSAMYNIDFFLWNIDCLKAKKVFTNTVLTTKEENVTVKEAMVFLMNSNKYIKSYLFDIPDNTTTYKQIMMLPYNLPLSIKSLQTRYGIYKRGIISFLDNGRFYLLKKYDTEHVIPKDEKKSVQLVITENDVAITQDTCVFASETNEQYNRFHVIQSNENRPALTEIFGDKVLFTNLSIAATAAQFKEDSVDFTNPILEIDNADISHFESGKKIVPEYDEINNTFIMNEYIQTSNTVPITIILNTVRYNSFDPYKEVNLRITNKLGNDRFGGKYQIKSVGFTFAFSNSGEMNATTDCNAALVLARTNLTDGYVSETENDDKE